MVLFGAHTKGTRFVTPFPMPCCHLFVCCCFLLARFFSIGREIGHSHSEMESCDCVAVCLLLRKNISAKNGKYADVCHHQHFGQTKFSHALRSLRTWGPIANWICHGISHQPHQAKQKHYRRCSSNSHRISVPRICKKFVKCCCR